MQLRLYTTFNGVDLKLIYRTMGCSQYPFELVFNELVNPQQLYEDEELKKVVRHFKDNLMQYIFSESVCMEVLEEDNNKKETPLAKTLRTNEDRIKYEYRQYCEKWGKDFKMPAIDVVLKQLKTRKIGDLNADIYRFVNYYFTENRVWWGIRLLHNNNTRKNKVSED